MTCYQLPRHLLKDKWKDRKYPGMGQLVHYYAENQRKLCNHVAAQVVMRCRLTLQNSKHARQDVQSYWQSDTWCLKSDLCL